MRHRRDTDERADHHDEPRPPEPSPAHALLSLQRSAGNRAVAAILARQPSPAAPPKGPAPQEDRAATMTAGLGEDLGVIPIDSYAWAEGHPGPTASANGDSSLHEVTIQFGPNPVAAQIAHAAANGKFIGKAFVSTQKVTFDLADTVLMNFKQSGEGSHGEVTSVTLNFASLEIRRPS